MLTVIAVFGVLIVLACGFGTANPQALIGVVRRFAGVSGLVYAVVLRIAMGIAALVAAPVSRAPLFLYIVGGIALAAAVGLAVIGLARYKRLIEWVTGFSDGMLRVGLLFGFVFGTALIWVSGILS